MPGGSWLGALISGFLSDIFGRKRAIIIGAVIWYARISPPATTDTRSRFNRVIGSIIVSASQNIGMLIVGRIINGLSVGICSPPSKRGRLVGAQQWAITWGILIMFYISYGCSFLAGPKAFRVPWALQMIPAIGLFFGMMMLPESPRWLARKDRWEDCHAVLALVHGKGDPNTPFVTREYQEIKEMVEFERQNADVTYLELLKPSMINRTHIGVFTQIWSQLTGMNVMMYYITYVFTMTVLEPCSPVVNTTANTSPGRKFKLCPPPLLFHPVHNQRHNDRPRPPLRRPLGPPPHPPHRRNLHDDLDVRQCRPACLVR